ncbi:hypothetical protein PBRA_009724 [Plasmodiophora brassicae]|uniref:Uncharacterized protein n=1 Tax=Plasmodiophora brassicae TaxID=37360 RepID=A0A0G4IM71_PLABS|nr:hypothetical protein PBRA_009724 [Plasmodiophora brassicae]
MYMDRAPPMWVERTIADVFATPMVFGGKGVRKWIFHRFFPWGYKVVFSEYWVIPSLTLPSVNFTIYVLRAHDDSGHEFGERQCRAGLYL